MSALVWLPPQQWLPCIPKITSSPEARSAAMLEMVIQQFGVRTDVRYAAVPPKPAVPATATEPAKPATPWKTFCKTYAWDIAVAMGVVFPHWVDTVLSGNPTKPGLPAIELNINAGIVWLTAHGVQRYGWRGGQATAEAELEAREAACKGQLAFAVWKNPGGHGHIVVLKPPRPGDDDKVTWCTQAGMRNFEHGRLTEGFPKAIKPVFFFHA